MTKPDPGIGAEQAEPVWTRPYPYFGKGCPAPACWNDLHHGSTLFNPTRRVLAVVSRPRATMQRVGMIVSTNYARFGIVLLILAGGLTG